jgi:hypothetical protein
MAGELVGYAGMDVSLSQRVERGRRRKLVRHWQGGMTAAAALLDG